MTGFASRRALLAAATPGPWRLWNALVVVGPKGEQYTRRVCESPDETDAALIAQMRADYPALLAIAQRALELKRRYEQAASGFALGTTPQMRRLEAALAALPELEERT